MACIRRPAFLAGMVCLALSAAPVLAQTGDAAALTVAVVKPLKRDWPVVAPANGWLKPWHEAVIASEIDGLRITDVLVDVGAFVKKGEPLATLSDETVIAELRRQQAAVEVAKGELAKARAKAARARRLQPSGAISKAQIADDLIAEQVAGALLESAEAALELQRTRLKQTTIVAVDDGLISSRTAQLGAVVSSGTELFRLVRQGRTEWQAEVPARYLPDIVPGLTATISGPADERISGKVRLVGPTLNPETARAIVYVELPAAGKLPMNFFASGHIELETAPALTVPETALTFLDGMSYVFTVNDENRVSRVRVQTGRRHAGEVEIVAGLDESALVVAAGGPFLSDNSLVRIEGD